MYDLDGVLDPDVTWFVRRHVRSLLTWDILVFFQHNPDAVVDLEGLASRLGRRAEEVSLEMDPLCEADILDCSGGLIRYRPSNEMQRHVGSFVDSCADKGRRLALIALVLHNLGPQDQEQV